jgi:hypothetical protein
MSPDASLLIEAINKYRLWLDVATAAVVVGLVGEYRKYIVRFGKSLRSRNWKAAWRTFLLLIFPLLVIGGVAGELWVNLSVSQIENAWETAQLPRDLNPKQQQEIADKIKLTSVGVVLPR